MKEFITKLINSLDIHSKGFSGRKLSALAVMVCVVIGHIKLFKSADWIHYFETILIVDYTFILACLGLVTWEMTKMPKKEENTPQNL